MQAAASNAATTTRVLRRIGRIGDAHGVSDALGAVRTFLREQIDLDAILCIGDIPGRKEKTDTDECVRLLTDADVLTVRGNHDRGAVGRFAEYSGLLRLSTL